MEHMSFAFPMATSPLSEGLEAFEFASAERIHFPHSFSYVWVNTEADIICLVFPGIVCNPDHPM